MDTPGRIHNRCLLWFTAGLFCLTLFPAMGQAVTAQDYIRKHIETIRQGGKITVSGARLASRIILPALYKQRNFIPLWHNTDSIDQLFSALDTIDEEGLDPRDYHLTTLRALRKKNQDKEVNPQAQAGFDLLLTDSLLRLGYHLQFGKVDPAALDGNWNIDRTIDKLDYIARHARAIRRGTVDQLIQEMSPLTPFYFSLMRAYRIYKAIQAKGGWPRIPRGATLRHGMKSARTIALRHRLASTEDMQAGNLDSPLFDDEVEVGVRHFQSRHGIEPDGIVNRQTLKALNVSIKARINQVRANLERARWVLPVLPENFVLVDIAGFNLAYHHYQDTTWKTLVQVGKTYRKTPVFKSKITYLVLNPTWTIPPTILREDVLPAVTRDPSYLKRRHIRVIDHKGKHIDESAIDWTRYPKEHFPYTLRREPGPGNPLGRIKFMFPNRHAVYLHDTPSKGLFDRKDRTSSSGCVRVQHPYQLAELLLNDPENWSVKQIQQAVATRKTRRLKLAKPVTVIIMYWTVQLDKNDLVHFRDDIYGRDRAIVDALKRPFKFRKHPILRVSQAGRINH